jgi:hypothetical protein
VSEKDALVATLATEIVLAGLPAPVREHRFHQVRRWRFDLAWPERKLYVEVHGGTWSGGAHSRGSGQRRDFDKQNSAVALGWRPIVVSTDMIRDGAALVTITAALDGLH